MSTLLVHNIAELCTCDAERGEPPGVIRDAAVVARDGVIAFVGSGDAIPASLRSTVDTVIDADGCAVMPGLVDAHSHIVWLGDRSGEYEQRAAGRSYEAIAAMGGGIRATVRSTAAGSLEELADTATRRAQRMRALGSTTIEVKSGYGVTLDAEMRQLDAANAVRGGDDCPDVVTTYLPLHVPPDADRELYIDSVCTAGIVAAASRSRFIDAFCEEGAFTVGECSRVLRQAQQHGLRVKLHAEQLHHSGGAALAAELHAVSADHLEHADESDLRALAAAGVVGVILPGASLILGGPPPPGRRILEAGATLAVATDCNPGTSYCESMPLMLSLAVATAGVTPAEALLAATAGGAAALALDDRGVLRPGLRCDLAVLSTPRWLDLAYHLGGEVVRGTVVAGQSTLAQRW